MASSPFLWVEPWPFDTRPCPPHVQKKHRLPLSSRFSRRPLLGVAARAPAPTRSRTRRHSRSLLLHSRPLAIATTPRVTGARRARPHHLTTIAFHHRRRAFWAPTPRLRTPPVNTPQQLFRPWPWPAPWPPRRGRPSRPDLRPRRSGRRAKQLAAR